MSDWWLTNWPINWVGNSVKPSDPPLNTRQNYFVSAILSASALTNGVHANPILQLSHEFDGGELAVSGRLILTRYGSREN